MTALGKSPSRPSVLVALSKATFLSVVIRGGGTVSTSLSDGRLIWMNDLIIQGNTFRSNRFNDIYLNRCKGVDILNNQHSKCGNQSLWMVDCDGRVKGNTYRNSAWTPLYVSHIGDLYFEENLMIDCGLLGTDVEKRTVSLVSFIPTPATTIPGSPVLRYLNFRRDEMRFTGTEGAGLYWLFAADPNVVVRLTDTKCNTGSTKVVRIENAGGVAENVQNDFNCFHNPAQNETPFTTCGSTSFNLPAAATASQIEAFVHTMTQVLKAKRMIR